MHKRTATGAISSPTADAGFGANLAAHELAAWAYRPGMPPAHTTEAQAKSNELAAKGPAPVRTKPASTTKGKGKGKR